jgi:hypothetical protein
MTSETIHNPDRFMADFRQILAQGRKRVGLLIGAGAPLSITIDKATGKLSATGQPLIPAVAGLTKIVIESLTGEYKSAVSAIVSELGSEANIEAILSRVRLLECAIGKNKINGLDGQGYKTLGFLICDSIGAQVQAPLPNEPNPYTELVSWVSGAVRQHPVEVFTTNYDLLMEEAFERARVPYFDGFSGGHAPFFDAASVAGDDLPPRWARLWKLHGSLGWALENSNIVRGRGKGATQLIYPDHLKYDHIQKQPYTALFERLKQFLLTPDSLLIALGFSFADAHVSAVVEESLAANANAAVFAFQYQPLDKEPLACALARNQPNVSVYAEDGAVIRGIAGPWKPGDPPKNWEEIRKTFWAPRKAAGANVFTLGDFKEMARFFALSQSSDVQSAIQAESMPDAETPKSPPPASKKEPPPKKEAA